MGNQPVVHALDTGFGTFREERKHFIGVPDDQVNGRVLPVGRTAGVDNIAFTFGVLQVVVAFGEAGETLGGGPYVAVD